MSLNCLPDEVLMNIFDLVGSQRSMSYNFTLMDTGPASLRLSRRFHNVAAGSFYRRVFVRDISKFEQALHSSSQYGIYIRDLFLDLVFSEWSCTMMKTPQLDSILSYSSNLKTNTDKLPFDLIHCRVAVSPLFPPHPHSCQQCCPFRGL